MRNAFDDPKMLSMILRDQRSGLSGVAADILADQRSGLSSVAADILAEQRSGLRSAAADILADQRSGLGSVAADILANQRSGLSSVATNLLAEHRAGEVGIALDTLAERRAGVSGIATDMFSARSAGTSVHISSALAAATLANTSVSQMIQDARATIDWSALSGGVSREWLSQEFGKREMLAAATGVSLRSHLIDISGLSMRAEAAVGRLLPDRLELALSISDEVKSTLTGTFVDFSRSYQNLWQSLESSPASMLYLKPALSRLPAVEYYNGAILANRLTGQKETEEDHDTQDGIVLETREVLNDFLSRLNPKLIAMRDGAREALSSTNPDRVRHFSISLRELFTQVLDQLAPDHEIKEWTSLPEHYRNGKPTRKTRLLYICRFINQKPLVRFVEKDIDAAVEFMNLFQRGTHAVDAQYTAAQLTALEVRMDSTLRFIFEVSQQR
jgi:predicted ABC-type ATPase